VAHNGFYCDKNVEDINIMKTDTRNITVSTNSHMHTTDKTTSPSCSTKRNQNISSSISAVYKDGIKLSEVAEKGERGAVAPVKQIMGGLDTPKIFCSCM